MSFKRNMYRALKYSNDLNALRKPRRGTRSRRIGRRIVRRTLGRLTGRLFAKLLG